MLRTITTHETFPLDEYRARIGARTDARLSVDLLEDLQRSQVYSIPFENFDIQLGRGIDLSLDHLIDKLVRSRRGGYCFELNGLFLAALARIGFAARPLLARVHLAGEPTGRGHQFILVTIDGREWITDVGFGGTCPRVPMPLEHGVETDHDGQSLRLVRHELGNMLQRNADGQWMDLYSFDLSPVVPNDIVYGNHFTATHPSSLFKAARVAVRCFPEGEARLFNFRCTTIRQGREEILQLPDDDGYLRELLDRFGIDLQAGYEALAKLDPQAFG